MPVISKTLQQLLEEVHNQFIPNKYLAADASAASTADNSIPAASVSQLQ